MSSKLTIVDVFTVSFTEGVMVIGDHEGDFRQGDVASLQLEDRVVRGRVGMLDTNRRDGDPANRLGIELTGELADVVRPGDTITIETPARIEATGTLTRVEFDFAVGLTLDDGTHLRLSGVGELRDGEASMPFDAEDSSGHAARLVQLLQGPAVVEIDGSVLTIRLADDASTVVTMPASEEFEAWQIRTADGTLSVCMPGGELAVWPAESE